jgi:hypothetical protein
MLCNHQQRSKWPENELYTEFQNALLAGNCVEMGGANDKQF